ncbi:Oxysterol-binding protein-related protein 10 [Tupaia chinensis]|uniref:Oxysterol-binding protein-related protein 10 n=1 Tax=Tupaia chinensis TaxID=246437 RepID=L9JFZ5_TUPCH|nr:Oxysterol-binding protein-related protein 10 [Tupaia chinensis]
MGWGRYFVLDFEAGTLQYFVNEQSKHQKPRGALSLSGAIVSLSDEAPHMLVVYSANGETYKLRDAGELKLDTLRVNPAGRAQLPMGASCFFQRLCRRFYVPAILSSMMNQVEGQQKNLVHAIESLPGSGPLTALDQDLLLLKATSAATLSCLGECLSLLQQSVHQTGQPSHKAGTSGKSLGPVCGTGTARMGEILLLQISNATAYEEFHALTRMPWNLRACWRHVTYLIAFVTLALSVLFVRPTVV